MSALRRDGTTISVEFAIVMLQNKDQKIGIAAIMRDVTKRFEVVDGSFALTGRSSAVPRTVRPPGDAISAGVKLWCAFAVSLTIIGLLAAQPTT